MQLWQQLQPHLLILLDYNLLLVVDLLLEQVGIVGVCALADVLQHGLGRFLEAFDDGSCRLAVLQILLALQLLPLCNLACHGRG